MMNNEEMSARAEAQETGQDSTAAETSFHGSTVIPQQTVLTVQGPRNRARTVALIAATVLCAVLCLSALSCTAVISTITQVAGISSDVPSIDSTPKVGVISLGSTIQYDGTSCSPSGLRSLLDQAKKRDDIKAVVLRVNSGGGVATAGEEMANYVRDFEKPIVVSCAASTASAAYEIASQADYIFAAKTSSVGSIGVAMQVTDLSGLYEKLGINIDTITSSDSKDATYGTRALSKSEKEWYQKMVDSIDDDFIETVASGRNMSIEDVKKLANGLTYTGEEAASNGLVNEIGYLEDAIRKASELSGSSSMLQQTNLSLNDRPDLSALIDYLGKDDSTVEDEGLAKGSAAILEEPK